MAVRKPHLTPAQQRAMIAQAVGSVFPNAPRMAMPNFGVQRAPIGPNAAALPLVRGAGLGAPNLVHTTRIPVTVPSSFAAIPAIAGARVQGVNRAPISRNAEAGKYVRGAGTTNPFGGMSMPNMSIPRGGIPVVLPSSFAAGAAVAGNHPQGQNETNAAYGIRSMVQGTKGALGRLDNWAQTPGRELAQGVRYAMATPGSDAARAFNAMLYQESGNKQFNRDGSVVTSNKGATGIAQVMPATGPEAARLAGLPWDPQRFKTDAEYNKALGFAYFNKKLQENNGDVSKAMAAYNAGQGRVNQAVRKGGENWMAFMPAETQNYVPSVLSRMGGLAEAFGAPAPGFNAAPYQQAMDATMQAAALMDKSYSASFAKPELPDRPTPDAFQAPDFSAGNTAFEATRPTAPFADEKEERKLLKQQYWKGIGQALASLSGGEGLGVTLARMGGGALMGRARGEEMIDAKEEEFEKEMRAYNQALAARNDSQAAVHANVLNQNIQQRNQFKNELWSDAVAEIKQYSPQVQDGKLITYNPDPKNPGQIVMNVTPLGFANQAQALLRRAEIGIQMGNASADAARFQYTAQQTSARTALGLVATAEMQNNPQARDEAYLTELGFNASQVVQNGAWKNLWNDKSIPNQLAATVYSELGVRVNPKTGTPAVPLTREQQEQFNAAISNEIVEYAINNGLEAVLIGGTTRDGRGQNSSVRAASILGRAQGTRTSQSTDYRGRTRTSTTVDWGE